ncbi:MAG TPA: MoaD/ThiS family protein [Spirochaetota bacterium]|nr:MoaD/ThiS family protein [Spirochaetota bacterium]HPI89199.1 MoaD/ThiS family protein [Spirochaetota bacterium]
MKIKIRTFASLREVCGFTEKELIVSEGIAVSEIIKELCRNCPEFAKRKDTLLFAVNEEYCGLDRVLNENDVLVIFPPVSGG